MRIVAETTTPSCKITVFSWNEKYLIKVEQPGLEQTFKISEDDLGNAEAVKKLLADENFIQDVERRFADMRASLGNAIARLAQSRT